MRKHRWLLEQERKAVKKRKTVVKGKCAARNRQPHDGKRIIATYVSPKLAT